MKLRASLIMHKISTKYSSNEVYILFKPSILYKYIYVSSL